MQIYYETLCPYSIDFFVQQFHPNFEQFGSSVRWTLIPFGHANVRYFIRKNIGTVTMIGRLASFVEISPSRLLSKINVGISRSLQITRDNNGNVVGITCQHKELECRGNAIQACALQKVSDYYTQIRFCDCFMVNKGDCDAFQKVR